MKNQKKKKINGTKIAAILMLVAMIASFISMCFMYF